MELIIFKCDTNLNQKFSETNQQELFLASDTKIPCAQIL
jgi:hypothetical protein